MIAIDPGLGKSLMALELSRDLPAFVQAIESVDDCRLVVIDPVTAYLGGTDSHNNADIRGLLAPLAELASRHQVAVVAVTHLNKNAGGSAIYRTMGSLAFAAAARAAWAVSKDKDDPNRRLLLPIKNNIAPDLGGLAYRIESSSKHGCPVVAWEPDPDNVSADEALMSERVESHTRTECDDAADSKSSFDPSVGDERRSHDGNKADTKQGNRFSLQTSRARFLDRLVV